MSVFDIAAVLIAVAATLGYVNRRWLRFPSQIGITAMALAGSIAMVGLDRVVPGWHMRAHADSFLRQIDFSEALLHGMLCFLLFAGALHVDWGRLRANGATVVALSTVGVAVSTVVVGVIVWALARSAGYPLRLVDGFVFGALISPTDPIAVIGLLKELNAPADLEANIAGEALFNDGVGVVAFFGCLGAAGLVVAGGTDTGGGMHLKALSWFFLVQAGGGVLLGAVMGQIAYYALKSVDHAPLELLITVALVMFTYSASFWIDVSGPLAIVVAGLIIGHAGRRDAMSERTRRYLSAFWEMIDEILNALLFLLLGLEALSVHWTTFTGVASALAIPVVLVARLISVELPLRAFGRRLMAHRGFAALLTWGGLRGGLSVAMVLSLPQFPARNLLLCATYVVVVFSILVQGLTMPRLCAHYGVGQAPERLAA